jgi:glucose/mannose transport system permease protein
VRTHLRLRLHPLTAWLSFTESRRCARLRRIRASSRTATAWWALTNLGIFGSLFIVLCLISGLLLAILLDQRIRAEGFLRAVYLYPMALSFIVTGTAWRWILNPGLGFEHLVRQLGFEHFTFDWIVTPGMSIYTVVIAGAWQSTGFVMALFLAGLRGIDDSIIKAAQVDGAGQCGSIPASSSLAAAGFSAHNHSGPHRDQGFDLVMALTVADPALSDLPATFSQRVRVQPQPGRAQAASAMMMLVTIVAVIVPMMYSETRRLRHG